MLNRLIGIYRRLIPAATSPLAGNGERVDIDLTSRPAFESMDMYQKNHYKRYLFASNYVESDMTCGDFACGSGYGSALLSEKAKNIIGVDISQEVIDTVADRYVSLKNIHFVCKDLRELEFTGMFDLITSFETIEHVEPNDVIRLLKNFSLALKDDGIIIFSTPYLQKRSKAAITMGFHLTFDIDEKKISSWLAETDLKLIDLLYQNYKTHEVVHSLAEKDFIICVARKAKTAV